MTEISSKVPLVLGSVISVILTLSFEIVVLLQFWERCLFTFHGHISTIKIIHVFLYLLPQSLTSTQNIYIWLHLHSSMIVADSALKKCYFHHQTYNESAYKVVRLELRYHKLLKSRYHKLLKKHEIPHLNEFLQMFKDETLHFQQASHHVIAYHWRCRQNSVTLLINFRSIKLPPNLLSISINRFQWSLLAYSMTYILL